MTWGGSEQTSFPLGLDQLREVQRQSHPSNSLWSAGPSFPFQVPQLDPLVCCIRTVGHRFDPLRHDVVHQTDLPAAECADYSHIPRKLGLPSIKMHKTNGESRLEQPIDNEVLQLRHLSNAKNSDFHNPATISVPEFTTGRICEHS